MDKRITKNLKKLSKLKVIDLNDSFNVEVTPHKIAILLDHLFFDKYKVELKYWERRGEYGYVIYRLGNIEITFL